MLKKSESTLRSGCVAACLSGEEAVPIFTQLETNLKASLNLKYPTYPASFSTVLLGNSPQSSNAKPKKRSLAPTRDEVGEFRFNQLRHYRRTFTENKERLNLSAPKTPTHMPPVQNCHKKTLNYFVNFAFRRGSGVFLI